MRLPGKRVLVTGGTGFVGGRLVEKLLLEEGATANCLVRNWTKAVWVSRTTADLLPGDVNEPAAVAEAMRNCQFVMHCASGGSTREQFFQTNVAGTRCLLEAAEKQGVERFVYVSSIAVHGASPASGASAAAPYDDCGRAYSASKIAAEKLVLAFAQQGRVPTTIIRPTFVWGPRSHLFTQGPLKAMKAGRFHWIDEGAGTCHAVHVDNLVESLILAASQPKAIGQAFLITDEANITWREFFQPLLTLLGIHDVRSIRSRSLLTPWLCRLKDVSGSMVERLSGDGKSLPVRVVRRLFRELDVSISKRGIPSLWDLQKFARIGGLDTASSRDVLGYKPVLGFTAAVEQTLRWVKLQLADELELNVSNHSDANQRLVTELKQDHQ